MSLLKWIARRWIPPWVRAETSYRLYLVHLKALVVEKDPMADEGLRIQLIKASEELGCEMAKEVRDAFKLGDAITDAVDAWKIGCVAAGVKYRVEREGEDYIFHHPVCPMHKYFTEQGIVPCEIFCLPAVTRIAKEICPGCEVEVIRMGDLHQTCIKKLKPPKR